jgi:uncharacterized protein (TIGR02284 family)
MAIENDKVISILNDLIETCRDGQEGFRAAAEAVKNSELKTLFSRYSQQRGQFVTELQNEVRRLGGDPEKSGTAAGALHRGWMNIKSAVTGGDERAIISECERGEDSAVKAYENALKETLPANVRSIVERQFREIKQAHDRIRSLERATGAAG